jgi:hypothetical protein
MHQKGPYYIGQITPKNIRNWLIDNPLVEGDTLLLHPHTYEDLAVEYREDYGTSMPEPYFLLGVLIDEAREGSGITVPKGRVLVLLEDDRPERQASEWQVSGLVDDGREVFRCGWCGNIVDSEGVELRGTERSYAITLLESRDEGATSVHGQCCPNGHNR